MKKLITASTIHQEKAAGHLEIHVSLPECIVTPEARLVASQIGLKIVETVTCKASGGKVASPALMREIDAADDKSLKAIYEAIATQLPVAKKMDKALITQLIKKTVATSLLQEPPTEVSKASQQIKHVPANTVQMGIFNEAGAQNQVGIADVITTKDNSPMAGGFMAWKNCFFPWTLNYDEIDLVLEGELHIRHQGQTMIGKTGDVLFIPKGSQIEFGTPTSVRFFYVAHPANWQDC